MFSKKDILNIAFRRWKGECLKKISQDYNTSEFDLVKLEKENQAEIAAYESLFCKVEIQRLIAGDPIRKIQYGFVLSAYFFSRTREGLPEVIMEFSQKSVHVEARLGNFSEAERVLESFEEDFGIRLL